MRLINTQTLQLEQFLNQRPPYAILSHTWGADEITLQEFGNASLRKKKGGFKKIELACAQARKDGLKYVWVDTCCIDKTGSAELSEAINSMFKWYKEAAICYAYLSDVPDNEKISTSGSKFFHSRWFTRGWTLQELIAPIRMGFYSVGWTFLGSKQSLTPLLQKATGINSDYLCGVDFRQASAAERMSWAARRRTTIEEDTAYCLMGLFDVHMPVMYGEGSKAFLRLQEQIWKDSDDHTLFAWRVSPQSAMDAPYRGLLADSPAAFAGCADIVPFRAFTMENPHENVTNRGIPLTSHQRVVDQSPSKLFASLNCPHSTIDGSPFKILANLNCRWGNDFNSVISIELASQGNDQFLRSSPDRVFKAPSYGDESTVFVIKSAHQTKIIPPPLQERQFGFYFGRLPEGMRIGSIWGKDVNFSSAFRILHIGPWISDKATVQLLWNDASAKTAGTCLLLFLWAEPVRSTQRTTYRHCFDITACSTAKVKEAIWKVRKPSQQVEERAVSLGSSSVALNIRLRKVQGFDMFVVEGRNQSGGVSGRSQQQMVGSFRPDGRIRTV